MASKTAEERHHYHRPLEHSNRVRDSEVCEGWRRTVGIAPLGWSCDGDKHDVLPPLMCSNVAHWVPYANGLQQNPIQQIPNFDMTIQGAGDKLVRVVGI